jgi:hypothetical protein
MSCTLTVGSIASGSFLVIAPRLGIAIEVVPLLDMLDDVVEDDSELYPASIGRIEGGYASSSDV